MSDPTVLAEDALSTILDPLPIEPGDVLAGAPEAKLVELATIGGADVGIWEITPGTVRDTEVDEVFVVLSGEATIRFADGRSVELRAGSVVRLRAGEQTEWEVRSTLRKVYVSVAATEA